MIKINFDGAIFNKEHKPRIGVVLCDAHGSVLASLSRQLSQVYSPLEIEVKAVSSALQFAVDLGFNQVVLERLSGSYDNTGQRLYVFLPLMVCLLMMYILELDFLLNYVNLI